MTSSEVLNSELFNLRDTYGVDIIKAVKSSVNDTHGVAAYFDGLTINDYYQYAGAGILGVMFLRITKPSSQTILYVGIAIMGLYLYNEIHKFASRNTNMDLLIMLFTLDDVTGHKHSFLYLEPDLIRMFADHLDLRKYAVDAFDRCLRLCDAFMTMYHDILSRVGSCERCIDNASDMMVAGLNAWSELDFALPLDNALLQKYDQGTTALRLLLVRGFREMQELCIKRPLKEFGFVNPKPVDMDDSITLDHSLYL